MTQTTIRGMQLRDASIARTKIDPAFEASLAQIESNITDIYSTMSTDAERMAAIAALTTAFQAADGSLSGMLTTLTNATRAGAGLQADGSYLVKGGTNYLGATSSIVNGLETLDAALKVEESARIAADAALQSNIQAIIDAGGAQAAADLADEVTARIAGDAALQTAIDSEAATRASADSDLQTQITNEVAARQALNTTLSNSIADEALARTNAVSAEATTRAAADTALQNAIDAEALARTNADIVQTSALTAEETARIAADSAEAAARAAADTGLDSRVTALEGATVDTLTYAKVIKREVPTGLVDGVNTLFSVAFDPVANTEEVFYNGQLLEPGAGADYTISGKDITLTFAPIGTDRVRVSYFR